MSCSTVEHFSHPQHQLVLKEDVIIEVDAKCSVCDKSVIGSPAYTCTSDDIGCRKFYLHKSCAELPKEITRHKQDVHPLVLQPCNQRIICNFCNNLMNFSYACDDCSYYICVVCAFTSTFVSEQKVIRHQGHKEHTLTLQRQTLFKCDACWEETIDYSYMCYTCDFWIHEKCASSPPIIPAPTYHHHSLNLIFSIPVMHRYFSRACAICQKRVHTLCWCYHCHKCTFFVHIKCSMSTISLGNDIEENGITDDEPDLEPDLVQIPLPEEESLLDLMITQCSKFQLQIRGEAENSANISMTHDEPHIIEKHWSHPEHRLELHHFTVTVNDDDNDNNEKDEDTRVLICDGCVQPITISHPCYYSCSQCSFLLHSFCATKLPLEWPAGASPFHPQHSLSLNRMLNFYDFTTCKICSCPTTGFFYECDTCDIDIEIRCAFLPKRIRHKSHKHHPLVQRSFSSSVCRLSKFRIVQGVEYACSTCSSFQIHIICAFYPSKLKHRYDDHSLILKYPPFFYEGVIYCQICEERVNNQGWLYHCEGCDQSFHFDCIRTYEKFKFGGKIKYSIGNQPHTLTLVLKKSGRRNSCRYFCGICGAGGRLGVFFECDGCGYLVCIKCVRKKKEAKAPM